MEQFQLNGREREKERMKKRKRPRREKERGSTDGKIILWNKEKYSTKTILRGILRKCISSKKSQKIHLEKICNWCFESHISEPILPIFSDE